MYFWYPIVTFWFVSTLFYTLSLDKFTKNNQYQLADAIISMLILNVPQVISTLITELYPPSFIKIEGFRLFYLFFGIFVIDTLEYFMHRIYHSTFLYKYHKVHHEIIDPFSFAAFYNSYSEAIITSSIIFITMLGPLGFTLEEFTYVYCLAIVATIMDHCDWFYKYKNHHLIHHKVCVHANYQQPFFDYWDRILKTKYVPLIKINKTNIN